MSLHSQRTDVKPVMYRYYTVASIVKDIYKSKK